ncbi:MAG: hypothetical protein V7K41_23990 [Nostoc sp.]|uniref:hypothetical protein n=1 Tax=Nostoc sp. TaxID=1180 RepID=UPI002FF6A603
MGKKSSVQWNLHETCIRCFGKCQPLSDRYTVVLNFSKYLERFRSAVHYDQYRALGLPIGSGEVESAHRYISQKRLKIPGATWHPDTNGTKKSSKLCRISATVFNAIEQ